MERARERRSLLWKFTAGVAIAGSGILALGNITEYFQVRKDIRKYGIVDVQKEREGRLVFLIGDQDDPEWKEFLIHDPGLGCIKLREDWENIDVAQYCEEWFNAKQARRRIYRDEWMEKLACVPKIRDEPYVKIVECEDGSPLQEKSGEEIFIEAISEIGYRYAIKEARESKVR